MTTTSQFQINPDYYTSLEECKRKHKKVNTNPRYKEFTQTHFTAGDEDQFQNYRDMSNGQVCIPKIKLSTNIFSQHELDFSWSKYQDLNATCVNNTFRYMFNKFKKGTFVKIQNNELKVFLPFSKKNFINEWGDRIKIDPKFKGDMNTFAQHLNKLGGTNYRITVNQYTDNWYANNCLVRYEYPINEGDTNVPHMCDMLKTLCKERQIPDIEFFMNRRDFPVLRKDGFEAYEHMFDVGYPLLSHNYDQYCPILSMVTTENNADIPIPTGDDWERISSFEGKYFATDCKTYPKLEDFGIAWKNRKPTAVFRGASTGCGVSIETNPRLKLAYLSVTTKSDNGIPLIDAGITKWNLRPRKLNSQKYLQTIDVPSLNKLGVKISSFLSPKQQGEYKYIVHVDGHVSAFRLSLEMSMGCCILLVDSKYKLWFRDMLEPMKHYIPVKEDLSDLVEQIKWCRENDGKCEKIAENAKEFYLKYLQKEGILDYLQKLVCDLKKEVGVYLYNTETPLQRQVKVECFQPSAENGFRERKHSIDLSYPRTEKTIANIGKTPDNFRYFGALKGLEWIISMINDKSNFGKVAAKGDVIFTNNANTIKVQEYSLAGKSFAVKMSIDKQKQSENIHEVYIGMNAINEVIKYIPNFAYVFGTYDEGSAKSCVIMEKIKGITFDKWITSSEFNMKDFLFILIQISLALEVAQRQIGFVHYDLTPWNIMIEKIPGKVAAEFDYMVDWKNVYRVKTNLIPIIIDYGKSHVIYNREHYGYINMFKVSTIQDVISILLTTIGEISSVNLSKSDVADIIKLSNFMSGTSYRKKVFKQTGSSGLGDVQFFVKRAKKYEEMITSDKYELEQRTPFSLVEYISKNFEYKFDYQKVDIPVFKLNRGNPRQIFEYILAENDEERIQSFTNVFNRVRKCEFPDHINLLFSYYSAQTLEENVTSVYNILLMYLKNKKIDKEDYEKLYNKTLKKIKTAYSEKLDEDEEEDIEYDLKDKFGVLEKCPYDAETFLMPKKIIEILTTFKSRFDSVDLTEYKEVIELILLNKGVFKMSEKHRAYYMKNFTPLLDINNLNMKNNIANVNTLRTVSRDIFELDSSMISTKLTKKSGDCSSAEKYLEYYKKIIGIVHSDKEVEEKSHKKKKAM